MRKSRQLVVESTVIAAVLIALALGGSIATTSIPPSFVALQDPGLIKEQHVLSALASYYNTTLAKIGGQSFSNASFLLSTFNFVNISPAVNATAQAANSDLGVVNATAAQAETIFTAANQAVKAKDFVNATSLVNEGCALAREANASLADFAGPQSNHLSAESVPTSGYTRGLADAKAEVDSLMATCNRLYGQLPGNTLVLLIGSPQTAIDTGGLVKLVGNLTRGGAAFSNVQVLFYINGTYFGELTTNGSGKVVGTLDIPFLYASKAYVQAFVAPNSTTRLGGATSNILWFNILFNETSIVVGDPPAYLPMQSFSVHGNLTTVAGAPLPDAPVSVTFFNDTKLTTTNQEGIFAASFTVPSNATDGTYFVFARFSPRGAFGPSFNFTSIQVYHLNLTLTLSTPSLSWAGFASDVKGVATSNGSSLQNARIVVQSPWGDVSTTTDNQGRFSAPVPVSVLEFALSREISVTADPAQPFIAATTVVSNLHLFNVFLIIIPGAVVAVAAYEVDRLGIGTNLVDRLRRSRPKNQSTLVLPVAPATLTRPGGPELVQLAQSAILLASGHFSVRFRESDTIREIIAKVSWLDKGDSFKSFSELMFTLEDFVFAPRFDENRIAVARADFAKLQEAWV